MKHRFIINITPLKSRRQQLRNTATPTEKLLWNKLRKKQLGFWFKRQVSIGGYVLDFYCPQKRLAIELDGKYHLTTSQTKYDIYRTEYLQAFNIRELRFWNHEVETKIDETIQMIKHSLSIPSP